MTNSRDIPRATPFVFLEIAIYGALVAAYLLFVLKALSPFLQAEAGSHHDGPKILVETGLHDEIGTSMRAPAATVACVG